MNKNSEINWLNVVYIREFQSSLDIYSVIDISMVSKLMREKLKPVLFKNLKLNLEIIKFDFNSITVADLYDSRRYDYNTLKEETNGIIEDSVNEFIVTLNDIKKYTKRFYLNYNPELGFYLYTLINVFDNLRDLKIFNCEIPFKGLVDIGKALQNLNSLDLNCVYLAKSTTDTISESDIVFPPNLSYLILFNTCITTSALLPDHYEYLFNRDETPILEGFSLPKAQILSLKRLDYIPNSRDNRGLESFLEVNPNIESLYTRGYDLIIGSSLNSLKSLDVGENISFSNIDQDFRLSSVNSLKFSTRDFKYSENIKKLCHLCPNVAKLSIQFLGTETKFQPIINNYLAPILSNLHNLKTLVIINAHIDLNNQTLDIGKLAQIEMLKIQLTMGSALNIKFDDCKNLKRIELKSYDDKFTDEFKRKFNYYSNWKFRFSEYTVKGYKI